MIKKFILTIENFKKKKRGWQLVSIYYLCRQDQETTEHLFNECLLFQNLWLAFKENLNFITTRILDIYYNFLYKMVY
jgi:zinc-binding in reverse transcriptase